MYRIWYCTINSIGEKMWRFEAFGQWRHAAFDRLIALSNEPDLHSWLEYKSIYVES